MIETANRLEVMYNKIKECNHDFSDVSIHGSYGSGAEEEQIELDHVRNVTEFKNLQTEFDLRKVTFTCHEQVSEPTESAAIQEKNAFDLISNYRLPRKVAESNKKAELMNKVISIAEEVGAKFSPSEVSSTGQEVINVSTCKYWLIIQFCYGIFHL